MIESLFILGLAATLVVLLHLRQQRAIRRGAQNNTPPAANTNTNPNNNTNHDNNHNQPAGAGAGGDAPENNRPEDDRGLFPRPGDPDYGAWIAGGVGH